MIEDLEFRMAMGEDYSAYIEWLDDRNNPIVSDDMSKAMMQVRQGPGTEILLEFTDAADPEVAPSTKVLGASGVIAVTCPKLFSESVPPGRYMCDMFVMHHNPDAQVFLDGQHHRLFKAWFVVENRITVTSESGGPLPPSAEDSIYKKTIGDGTSTSFVLTHMFNTSDVEVTLYSVHDGTSVDATVVRTNLVSITVIFDDPPPANSYRVIVTRKV